MVPFSVRSWRTWRPAQATLLRVKRCEREAMLPWSAGCPALGGLSGVLLVGVFRARAGGGTLELAGPNSDLAAHRRPVTGWARAHPGNLRTRLARASGSHAVLRSVTRTDSDQNHTSQALELAAGDCGNSIKRASDSRTEAPSQPARSSWRRAGLSHSGAVAAASLNVSAAEARQFGLSAGDVI
eukprot:scaffold70667_cov77-Phaeocystis_antarctica.AAC.2